MQKKSAKLFIAKILSGSMNPILHQNMMVVLSREKSSLIRVGDVIGFISTKGIPLVHRVIHKDTVSLQTMADANLRSDETINVDAIIGKVIMIKQSKKWVRFQKDTVAIILAKCIATLSFIVAKHKGLKILSLFRMIIQRMFILYMNLQLLFH